MRSRGTALATVALPACGVCAIIPNKRSLQLREVDRPNCSARFGFRRAAVPYFDACGFRSYKINCNSCGARLAGVIDPFSGDCCLQSIIACRKRAGSAPEMATRRACVVSVPRNRRRSGRRWHARLTAAIVCRLSRCCRKVTGHGQARSAQGRGRCRWITA
jgi:hypothetical protein